MPDLSGRELLREWERVMHSVFDAAASATGGAELPRRLLEPMQRQLELVQQLIERERTLQKELASRLAAPIDALEETAALMKGQAEMFEQTVARLREPAELAKAAAGLERRRRSERPPRSK